MTAAWGRMLATAALMACAEATRGPPTLEQQFTANSSESTFINGKFLDKNYFEFHFDVPGQRYAYCSLYLRHGDRDDNERTERQAEGRPRCR